MQYPQNDAMVVNMNIANYDVHHYMLIENESFMDVLFYEALLKVDLFRMVGSDIAPITGFPRELVPVEETIILPIIAGQASR